MTIARCGDEYEGGAKLFNQCNLLARPYVLTAKSLVHAHRLGTRPWTKELGSAVCVQLATSARALAVGLSLSAPAILHAKLRAEHPLEVPLSLPLGVSKGEIITALRLQILDCLNFF